MLRKIGHIALIFLLLLSTMGITISKHFCNDKLISQGITSSISSCCGGDDSSCQMCHTEHIKLKVEDDFQDSSDIFDFQQIALNINFVYTLISSELRSEELVEFPRLESPPPLTTLTFLSLLQTYLC